MNTQDSNLADSQGHLYPVCLAVGWGACLDPDVVLLCLHSSIHKLRENVFQEHQTLKEKELETGPKASHGYGGKFGVEQDRMDKVSGSPGWAAGLHGYMMWVAVTLPESQFGVGFAEGEGLLWGGPL